MSGPKARRRSCAAPPIRFGTSGWRGVLGEEVTFPRLRAVVRGAGAWWAEQDRARRGRLLVGFDGRFASAEMASMSAAILEEEGFSPLLADRPLPTPVVAAGIRPKRAMGALVLTASHNPDLYHGLKLFRADGGGIDDAGARRVEAHAARALARDRPAPGPARAKRIDLLTPYLEELLAQVDRGALRRARARVVYDAMHGVGSGVVDRALSASGAAVEVLRGARDPLFGGEVPDPVAGRLVGLARRVRAGGADLGLASDGDADRLAVVDERGRLLSATQLLAVLVDHLAATGRLAQGIAVSVATGSLVERVAAFHGLAVARHPIGFKHLSRALVEGRADAAGEESGGFAWARLGRDKDGIAAALLCAELVAGGEPLSRRVRSLERRFGGCACGRRAVALDPRREKGLASLCREPPGRVGGARVRSVARDEGLHLGFSDGFLMLRRSGTEPVLRLYAEGPSEAALERRLDLGERLLARRGAG